MSDKVFPELSDNEIRKRTTSFIVPLEVSRRVYTQEKFDNEFEYVTNVRRFYHDIVSICLTKNNLLNIKILYIL